MKMGKMVAILVVIIAIVSSIMSFKARRITDVLWYSIFKNGIHTCTSVSFVTTTLATVGTITLPTGAVGWYTTSLCNAPQTTRAIASPN